jgi:gamma-glutamyltranspeptidase/glutathione hydrolase
VICDYLARHGGIISVDDLRNYQTVVREPVRGTYRGYEVVGVAPPSAGGVHLIEALNILEGFDMTALGFGTADSVHLLAETMKLVFEDRDQYTGDPAFVELPVDMLLSKGHAEQRRYEISTARAQGVGATAGSKAESHTTHVTAVDADGNIAAMTQTINDTFGSKMTVPGTGVLLNNTMSIFDPHPGNARSIQPGKRMTSSMAPTIVLNEGIPEFAVGLPGGVRIFTSVLQAIVNVIDHGMTPQEAVEAPRAWCMNDSLELEPAFGDNVTAELSSRGHAVSSVNTVGGGMNMVRFEPGGMLTGASCWRADGSPVALGGGAARSGIRFRTQAGQDPLE